MKMDFEKCVAFVRKYALPGERLALMGAPSKPYRNQKTTIHLTYFSMPDWLAVISAARWPQGTGSAEEPIRDVLGAMAMESDISAVLGFLKLLAGEPIEREPLFRQLVLAYRIAVNQHQKSVADCLKGFTDQGSGRALLAELGRTGRTITVMPHWHHFMALPKEGYRNASERGIRVGQKLSHITDGITTNDSDAYAKGAPIESMVGSETGTGKGANSIVYYSAGTFTDPRFIDHRLTDATVGAAGFEADVVLFHELVHATRTIRGKETHVPVDGRPDFGNIEEYFATVIANIYLSEKDPNAPLRGVYALPAHPTKDWSVMKNPDGFYDNNDGLSMSPHQLMETFKGTQGQFYDDLRKLPTPPKFNPVRTHFDRSQKSSQRIPV
jgi:hypothetical protein